MGIQTAINATIGSIGQRLAFKGSNAALEGIRRNQDVQNKNRKELLTMKRIVDDPAGTRATIQKMTETGSYNTEEAMTLGKEFAYRDVNSPSFKLLASAFGDALDDPKVDQEALKGYLINNKSLGYRAARNRPAMQDAQGVKAIYSGLPVGAAGMNQYSVADEEGLPFSDARYDRFFNQNVKPFRSSLTSQQQKDLLKTVRAANERENDTFEYGYNRAEDMYKTYAPEGVKIRSAVTKYAKSK